MTTERILNRGGGEYSYRGWRIWKRAGYWMVHPHAARDFDQAHGFRTRAEAVKHVDEFEAKYVRPQL